MTANTSAHDLAIGIDVGGTNIRAALYRGLDERLTEPLATHRELVADSREPEKLARRLAQIIGDLSRGGGGDEHSVPVGIGLAGMLCGHDGQMANSPHLGWRNVHFGPIIRAQLGDERPMSLHNDANAITYGEYRLGAGVGSSDLLAVYVGTGIGGGMVVAGRLVEGATNCAGEIGHCKVAFSDDALPCYCGMRGCVETVIGGTYVQARIRRDFASGVRSAAMAIAGGDPDAVHIGHLDLAAAEGDSYALNLYSEIAPPFAATLGNALSLLNPSRLVLGGGVLSRAPVLQSHVIASLEVAANRAILDPVTVVEAALGDDAGLVGGALLAIERARKRDAS